MRICTKCNEELPLTEEFFAIRENGLFRRQCRKCVNADYNARQAKILKDKRAERQARLDKELELFNNGYKICSSCNQKLYLSYFNKQVLGRFGLESICRNCRQSAKEKRDGSEKPLRKCRHCGAEAKTPSELSIFVRASGDNKFGRHNECKSCKNKRQTKAYKLQPLIKRCKKFGITIEQYEEMVSIQNNSCAICRKHKDDFSGRGNNFHIDHCHTTGKLRGLLCSNCNTGLGQFKDDGEIMKNAIEYIKRSQV